MTRVVSNGQAIVCVFRWNWDPPNDHERKIGFHGKFILLLRFNPTPYISMNIASFSVTALAAVFLVACGPSEAEIAAAKEKATADSLAAEASKVVTYTVDPSASQVTWEGNMTGAKIYSHNGYLKLTNGTFTAKGPLLQGGEFTVDMTTMTPTDDGYSAERTKEMLVGHLSSPDFFDVPNNPTASLKVLSVEGNTATAELTLRGKTNTETIKDIVITPNPDGTVSATANLTFDRQKYGAAFPGPAQDLIIANDVDLKVELTGKAQ